MNILLRAMIFLSLILPFSLPSKSPEQISRVKGSPVYVYSHVSFSSVTCTKVEKLLRKARISEQVKLQKASRNIKSSASYFPHFYGDKQCKSMLTDLVSTECISEEDQMLLQKELEKIGRKLSSKIKGYGCALVHQEDDWTERLHYCLAYNNIDNELTAGLRGTAANQSWFKRLPCNINSGVLMLRGAPDLIIKAKSNTEGVFATDSYSNEKDMDTDELSVRTSSFNSNGHPLSPVARFEEIQ